MSKTIVGTFEPNPKGGGFLRSADANYSVNRDDVFVPPQPCQQLRLRGGETVVGTVRSGKSGKPARFNEVETINGLAPEAHLQTSPFKDLVAIDPHKRVAFETDGGPLTMRVIDLMTPIGFGQRGLLVAPPRTGKTVLLQQMAHGVATNYPDVYMMVLLIDERPEEVTEMRREVNGEVIASSNDENIASHVRIARLMIEKAKRHVECGEDVLVLLDSLTRVGRAFNSATRGRGRTMSGGLDSGALTEPKSIFGAARNVEGGGSLTIVATALIDTGSRMDEVIFNEFKGTGNMEIVLTRDLANMRIWPAIDLQQSGTRKEERLLSPEELEVSHQIRRTVIERDPRRSMESLLDSMGRFSNNAAFVKDFGSRAGRR
jgi:transcription termination factor Rho